MTRSEALGVLCVIVGIAGLLMLAVLYIHWAFAAALVFACVIVIGAWHLS